MQKKSLTLLFVIFFLGVCLRFINLGNIPRGFTPDEASQAYAAFSLLKTGKDEWGIAYPLSSFKSFLDYKSPLQTYLMVPSIAIFGLNEFAARFPSALFGSLAILSAYLLATKITSNSKIGLLSAFILATSPWAIQFSRMALEANLAVFLITTGLYFFLSVNKNYFYLPLSAIFFSLSLYSYHAAKLFVPLLLLSLFFIFKKTLLSFPKATFASLALGIILTLPLTTNIVGEDSKRGSDLLITNLSTEKLSYLNDTIFYSDLYQVNQYLPRVFHNKVTLAANDFINNYLSYFSPNFWFLEGGREITYSVIPGRGLLLLIYLPFLIFGLVSVYKSGIPKSHKYLLFTWLLLAPLPASLTKEGYRPNRAISFMFLLEFFAAFGVYAFLTKSNAFLKLKSLFFSILVTVSLVFYLEDYFFSSHAKFPEAMSYGWSQTVSKVSEIQSNYQSTVVEKGSQSQSMFAFYQVLPPENFQTSSSKWQKQLEENKDIKYLDQLGDYSLGNVRFKSFSWPEDTKPNTLFVATKIHALPTNRRTLHTVTTPQGKVLFEIFDFEETK